MHSGVPDELLSVLLVIMLVERYLQICLCILSSNLLVSANFCWISSIVGNRVEMVGGGGKVGGSCVGDFGGCSCWSRGLMVCQGGVVTGW